MSKKKISILIIAIGVIIAGAIVLLEFYPQIMSSLSPSGKVAGKTVDYINGNLLQPGQTAVLESYSVESGLIKLVLDINGQAYDSYVTKDGKLLFPISAVEIGESSDPSDNQQGASSENPIIAEFAITNKDHIRGDVSAPVTLVEFSDFECPFCEKFTPVLKKILEEYQDKVRLVYKHFPLEKNPSAQKAAEASECAAEQGKFWEYHDALFENQKTGLSVEKLKGLATELSLNAGQFNDCLDASKYAAKVQEDIKEGLSKGVGGTPTTFVNGEFVAGAVSFETLKQKIDNLLKNKN